MAPAQKLAAELPQVAVTATLEAPRRPWASLTRRLILAVFLTVFSFNLLHRPASHCYRQLSGGLGKPRSIEQRTRKVLSETPLIDGHVDFPLAVRMFHRNHIYNEAFSDAFQNGTLFGQVDLARLRKGQSGGFFASVFAPCPADGADFSDQNYATSVQFTLEQIDVQSRIIDKFPMDFAGNLDSSGVMSAFKQGKLVSPLGVEGLHQIGNLASNLRLFYQLGVRYATLTHNCHNKFADAAVLDRPSRKAEPFWGGVSPLGRKMIHEMNRIGMIVDISHVSEDTMVDVLGGRNVWHGSSAPVIFSHSSAWSICPHPRNVKDHVLQLVKERNSLVMVNIAPQFISCADAAGEDGIPDYDPANATLDQVVKHIMHIGNLIGFDHVGIGTDFDGIETVPRGFEDVSKYPALVAELLRQGISDSDAAKIVGGNLIRVWKDVDTVAAKMKANGAPVMEDDVKGL